ncbi:MAG: hypothetical protein OEZ59_02090 [Deltaproteobacteria bacterium]|nr:hypothetical protein [Deltaproteobacteria bacterium]
MKPGKYIILYVFSGVVLAFAPGLAFAQNGNGNGNGNGYALFQMSVPKGSLGLVWEKNIWKNYAANQTYESQESVQKKELRLSSDIVIFHKRFISMNLLGVWEFEKKNRDSNETNNKDVSYRMSGDLFPQHNINTRFSYDKKRIETQHTLTSSYSTEIRSTELGATWNRLFGILPFPLSLQYTKSSSNAKSIFKQLNIDGVGEGSSGSEMKRMVYSSHYGLRRGAISATYLHERNKRVREFGNDYSDIRYVIRDFKTHAYNSLGHNGTFRFDFRFQGKSQSAFPKYRIRKISESQNFKIYDTFASSLYGNLGISGDRRIDTSYNPFEKDEKTVFKSSGGLNHRLYKSLYTKISNDYTLEQNPDYKTSEHRTALNTNYLKNIPGGKFNFKYDFSRTRVDNFGSNYLSVLQRMYRISFTIPIILPHERVAPGSVEVWSQDLQTKYLEGVDYILIEEDLVTTIQLLSTTSIINNQTVLVSYQYKPLWGHYFERKKNYSFRPRWNYLEPFYNHGFTEYRVMQGDREDFRGGRNTNFGARIGRGYSINRIEPTLILERKVTATRHDTFEQTRRELEANYLVSAFIRTKGRYTRINSSRSDGSHLRQTDARISMNFRRGNVNSTAEFENRKSYRKAYDTDARSLEIKMQYKFGKWYITPYYKTAAEKQFYGGWSTNSTQKKYTLGLHRSF